MDLKIFFSPLEEEHFSHITNTGSFFKNISVNMDGMPDYRNANIAIMGVGESRGSDSNKGTEKGVDVIRQKLYALKKGFGTYKVVDLGNLRPGIDLDETYGRIKEVCHLLLEQNVLPLIIGGSHDLDFGQYKAYENMDKLISLLNVDAFLDMEDKAKSPSHGHINRILVHEPNYLFNYSHLAYQSYLINQSAIDILEKLYFEAYRIGHLRSNITEMEPIIRNADMLSFDITAIKSSDAPGNQNAQPFGLSGEEACQICWYAGLNEKLSSVGFYEYNPDFDDDNQKTASVIATMIWYFIEGYYHRKNEQNFKTNDYTKFVVSMPNDPETLSFFKSKLSEKWWLEVPFPQGRERYARNCIIPCSYSDYQLATKGELPERYISTHAKLI
ncbi:MAG: formimidoylglutamase [Bacteroidota bacterium]